MALMDLFRPRWRNSRPEVRVRALQQVTDPAVLTQIALDRRADAGVRILAASKLMDRELGDEVVTAATSERYWLLGTLHELQRLDPAAADFVFGRVARNPDASADARSAAAFNVADESVLASIAKIPETRTPSAKSLRSADARAVDKLTRRDLLADIAGDENVRPAVRVVAAERLLSLGAGGEPGPLAELAGIQQLLADMARSPSLERAVRMRAIRGLNDTGLLLAVVTDPAVEPELREAALDAIEDPSALAGAVGNASFDAATRVAIAKRLSVPASVGTSVQAWLETVVENGALDAAVRVDAASLLTDASAVQRFLTPIAEDERSTIQVRLAAVKKITDQKVLARIATTGRKDVLQRAAAANITDPAIAAGVARATSDHAVRGAMVKSVVDQTLLAEIALTDGVSDVGLAAVERLTQDALLAEVALRGSERELRRAAVARMSDPDLLRRVAREGRKGQWVKLVDYIERPYDELQEIERGREFVPDASEAAGDRLGKLQARTRR